MANPFSQRGQAPYTCSECDEFFVVEVTTEADIVYPKLEECPSCKAPIDIDVLCGAVTPLRF